MSLPPPLSLAARSLRSSAVRDLLRDAHLPDMVSLAGGLPDAALFDVEGIEAAWEALRQRGLRETLQYGQTDGDPGLRETLAGWTRLHGTPAAADDVLVTTGSQQALDLVARTLLDPGDTVVTESPTYLAALQVFQLAGARLWTLPNDADGAIVDRLSALPAGPRPKLVYLVTNFANPSGASLSLERRLALLRWAAEHQVFVLEDDPYGLLRFDGAALPSLRALSSDVPGAAPWVGYASSLSKVLAPGLRLGWVLLPPALRAACVRVKQALDLHTATVTQALAAELLRSDRPRQHLPRLRRTYAERRDRLCDALQAQLGDDVAFERPEGGMFVWARLSEPIDTARLLPAARAAGVLYVPGEAFESTPGSARHHLRLSFVSAPPERLALGVQRLARAMRSHKP
jgi:DNA-binding transcriptional MocR family regulator